VRQGGDHRPRAVGVHLSGGKVRQRLVFEIADGQFDLGMIAVIDVGGERRDGSVGHERVVAPVRPQPRLVLVGQPGAAHDQPPVLERELGDLGSPPDG
jgi:hypothetical protein